MITDFLEVVKIVTSLNDIETFNMIGGHLSKPNDPELNYKLLKEELDEYLHAAKNGDKQKIADSLGDLMVVLWGNILKEGMGSIFFENILKPICNSNMSKFCRTEEEAKASVTRYWVDHGIRTTYKEIVPGFYAIINDHDGHEKKGKILKGINYREPEINI